MTELPQVSRNPDNESRRNTLHTLESILAGLREDICGFLHHKCSGSVRGCSGFRGCPLAIRGRRMGCAHKAALYDNGTRTAFSEVIWKLGQLGILSDEEREDFWNRVGGEEAKLDTLDYDVSIRHLRTREAYDLQKWLLTPWVAGHIRDKEGAKIHAEMCEKQKPVIAELSKIRDELLAIVRLTISRAPSGLCLECRGLRAP